MKYRALLWPAAILSMFSIGGCGSLLTSDSPAETVYLLEAPAITTEVAPGEPAPSIRVAVSAAPGLDVERILRKGPGATLRPYAGARWADNIPEVFETAVRTALEDSGRFGVVSAASGGSPADWRLALEVRAFYAVVDDSESAPVIETEVRGYVTCPARVMPLRLRATSKATSNTLTGITAAFQNALDDSLRSLIGQLPARC